MKTRTLVANGLFAALYVAVTALITPFGFTHIQFRISEIFNHLIVFNSKYFYGIMLGVILSNFFFSPMVALDLQFGVLHSGISLLIAIALKRWIHSTIGRMIVVTISLSFNMYFIAIMLKIAFGVPFLFGWFTTAAGELITLAFGIPIMIYLNKRLNFSRFIEG